MIRHATIRIVSIKLGLAFEGMREKIFIATKTGATTPEDFWKELGISLANLRTDYIDVYQFHNPAFCPKPGTEAGCMSACSRQRRREKSAISVSRITV